MMDMEHLNPAFIKLPSDSPEVKRFLTYDDKSVGIQISRLRQNFRWKNGDPDGFHARMEVLKDEQKVCLLKYTNDGTPYTYSGLWQDLQTRFGWGIAGKQPTLTEKSIPWAKEPFEMRYYQKEAVEELLKVGHGAIELSTGSGKSRIVLELLKRTPVQTIVTVPFASIATQLYNDAVKHFGIKYVGKFGDGKKEYKKLFTIAVAQSLTKLQPGQPAYETLSKVQQIIFDESHFCSTETFKAICVDKGVASAAPLRFFVSATQMRGDGSGMLLTGITGPVVYRQEFRDLAEQGFLKKPTFHIFNVPCTGNSSKDPKKETREQIHKNPNVNRLAGDIATKMVSAGRQVVILIEEYDQFVHLKPYLGTAFEFLHGPVNTQEAKDCLPKEYWKCDIEKTVQDFNDGKVQCLIGTTAISTGVDLRPVGGLIYLQGGSSWVKVQQGVGRGTRPVGPADLWVVDFRVQGSQAMERHIRSRLEVYDTLSDNVHCHGWTR